VESLRKLFELYHKLVIISCMKRLSFYFLAFITFWVSSWMVTDIHAVADSAIEQPHPLFSLQKSHDSVSSLSSTPDPDHHCGVCSYDHGGHMGQSLPPVSYITYYQAVNNNTRPVYSDSFNSRFTTPRLRPPIV